MKIEIVSMDPERRQRLFVSIKERHKSTEDRLCTCVPMYSSMYVRHCHVVQPRVT